MICPLCQQETTPEHYGTGMRRYTSHRCLNQICTLNDLPRWTVGKTYDDKIIIFYKIVLPYKNKIYVIQADAPHWTRLYYNEEDYGALAQEPIIEVPGMLPLTEPYYECIQKHLNKLINLIPFI